MMLKFAQKVKLGAAVLAAAAALSIAVPAQAAIFQGDWDPAFGSDFPDLGWRGEVDVFIPNACLGLDGWVSFLQCDGMKILEAEVEFYNLNNPAITLETLFFDVPSEIVFAVNLDEGQLKGLLGGFPYYRETTLDIAGASDNAKFHLLFVSDIPVLKFSSDEGSGRSDPLSTITFQLVPEPGALALLGLGLGMIGLMMRQRRRVPATAAGASSSPHSAVA
jgi:hypothetical protein